jgi:hypothetical protein
MNTEEEIHWEKELYGGGYDQLDRERDRKRKKDFWTALDGMSTGVALMVDWAFIFGSAVDVILPYLEVTGERTESFPCPAETPCGCWHTIGETARGEWIASCSCDWNCGTYELAPGDILFHGINRERFGDAIRRALGFAEAAKAPYVSAGLREIGTYTAAAVPVYLSLENENGLLRELTKLLGLRDGPFLLLTPAGGSWSPEVEALARAHGGGHVALASVLECRVGSEECRVGAEKAEMLKAERRTTGLRDYGTTGQGAEVAAEPGAWEFKANGMLEPMLAEYAKRVAALRDSGGTLRNIHREIAAVRGEFVELRSAKQRLEKMLADGLFAFTRKVDAASFKVLCCVLAEGDVAKASRTLAMPDGSVRTLMRRWRRMGKEYRGMLELVRWRKAVGRQETVALNDNVLLGKAETGDYPGLIADVLEKVTEMTGDNWREKAEELEEMLRGVDV